MAPHNICCFKEINSAIFHHLEIEIALSVCLSKREGESRQGVVRDRQEAGVGTMTPALVVGGRGPFLATLEARGQPSVAKKGSWLGKGNWLGGKGD